MATNLGFALALVALSQAQGAWSLAAGWLLLGVAMGAGLYDSAFATLVRLYGSGSRGAITGITLVAGFASTVGWPLSAWMEAQFGWRGACLGWAALHLLLGLPLNAALPSVRQAPAPTSTDPPAAAPAAAPPSRHGPSHPPGRPRLTAGLLAFVFASGWFVATSMATHLPSLLQGIGLSAAAAAGMGALIGPAQVGARMLEFAVLQRWHPLLSARLACIAHPAAAGLLAVFGVPFAAGFTLMHGAGQGILTIAKGTLPLAFFGPDGYGARLGWITMPARLSQAFAPFAFGLALAEWGSGALVLTSALGLLGFAALWWLPHAAAPARRAAGTGAAPTA
jgi:hypothetical protein